MKARLVDKLKMAALLAVRAVNRASVESFSTYTYRRRIARPTATPVEIRQAAEQLRAPDLPAELYVARVIPPEGRLGLSYVAPYYWLAKLAFELYRRFPIPASVEWDPSIDMHLKSDEGWYHIDEDDEFTALRLQGPNPFLLRRVEGGAFEVNYTNTFRGVHAPVICRFELERGHLAPRSIQIGEKTWKPGEDGFQRAKRIANGLDARYTVFGHHLLRTHLVVGQCYALAASTLPPGHPIRAFFDLYSYGTLEVNRFAYRLLIAPTSYFILSNFITRKEATRIFANEIAGFSLDELVLENDVRARGIDAIPDHPYVADGREAWGVMERYAAEYVAACYQSDVAVRSDAALWRWHRRLIELFPEHARTGALTIMKTREDLTRLLTCLLYNNVAHEICGDFSPYATSPDPAIKRLIHFARLDEEDGPVALNDVFLFEQGAFSGLFNTAGNNMLKTPLERFVTDQRLLDCTKRYREALRALNTRLEQRNAGRKYPFRRMRPDQWEMSISF